MKIILDANIILEDVHLASNRFTSLFVFMRRTNSTLVVPNLVLEEVLGHHERFLREKLEKMQRAADDVRRLLINQESTISKTEAIFIRKVDIPAEQRMLKEKLFRPAPGIRTALLEESVDIKEVYRRGILRKRPASDKGEELRDVILWLSVLQHAQGEKSGVAFISKDNGFWDGTTGLHADIAADISLNQVDVRVYRDIEDFNKANALNSRPWGVDEIEKLIDIRSLDDQIIEKVKARLDGVDLGDSVTAFRSGSVRSASFESGVLYEVQPNAQFAEVPYKANLEVTLASTPKPKLDDIWVTLLNQSASSIFNQPASGRRSMGLSSISPPLSRRVDEVEMKFAVPVTGRASLRIVDSKVESAEIDRAALGKQWSEVENRD
jgi:hypothetical protein